MRFWAGNCGCGSRNRVTVPATMPCCWRRRRRRARGTAWSISAPASAPRDWRVARRVAGIDLVLVEIDPDLAELARGNAAANAMAAEVIALDVTASADAFAAAGLTPDSADVVLMNPPFNDPARHRASPDKTRATAHVATAGTLEGWIHASRRILKSGGILLWSGGPTASRKCSRRSIAASVALPFCQFTLTPGHRRFAF